ncbi:uncharacterized protein BYT42DRAFT_546103 [Radiomyces spectabilis]|uniref:uncharacterized protein n=1 Tax=Radiomyces spectabilis TaxID=64574 RepID=UPI00221E3C69|nr:uncharacterized protein BYT42DRAFT_546103 [Radiomyces spectabilis]KAI8377388.1 hypothetical protein BYT42DRAFT_546103 [Radiomyces spectabilis]
MSVTDIPIKIGRSESLYPRKYVVIKPENLDEVAARLYRFDFQNRKVLSHEASSEDKVVMSTPTRVSTLKRFWHNGMNMVRFGCEEPNPTEAESLNRWYTLLEMLFRGSSIQLSSVTYEDSVLQQNRNIRSNAGILSELCKRFNLLEEDPYQVTPLIIDAIGNC